jgi:hypothetical protein
LWFLSQTIKTEKEAVLNDMNRVVFAVAILAFGLAATLVSGFYRRDLSIPGRTDIGYGLPLTWHGESGPVIFPEVSAVGWLSWEYFALDTAFWSLAITIAIIVLSRLFKTRKSKGLRHV